MCYICVFAIMITFRVESEDFDDLLAGANSSCVVGDLRAEFLWNIVTHFP